MKTRDRIVQSVAWLSWMTLALGMAGCSSTPEVKKQSYAALRNHRVFEVEYPKLWKAIEETLRNHRVVERDPKEVAFNEWSSLRERTLETDWIFTQSKDKYQEYTVNGFPRKKYLQTKMRYRIQTRAVMGGVEVTVLVDEEIERLRVDGASDGYSDAEPDPARGSEMLDRINAQLLALPAI